MRLRKIKYILTAVLMLSMFSVPVMAQEVNDVVNNTVEIDKSSSSGETTLTAIDTDELGSITIQLEDTSKKHPKNDVTLAVVKVADVVNGEFVLTEDFASVEVDLNEIQNANELENAAKKLAKVNASNKSIVITDANGTAVVSDLPVGAYLIYATDIGKYENITPFLISIPTFSEEDGKMLYDVEVLPKHSDSSVNEHTSVPNTGVDNKFFEYAVVSAAFLLSAGAVMLIFRNKKKTIK